MTRALLVLLAALSLGACNAAVSTRPLFSARDARGAPGLKPGLWAMLEDEPCAFDRTHPNPWPDCAKPVVIDTRTLKGPEKDTPPIPYLFAGGDPRILQLTIKDKEAGKDTYWAYLAVEPSNLSGPVTEASAWLVQCGPPPESQPSALTQAPLPGMSIRDQSCYAADAETIRNAAAPSRAWGEPMRLIWVDGIAR